MMCLNTGCSTKALTAGDNSSAPERIASAFLSVSSTPMPLISKGENVAKQSLLLPRMFLFQSSYKSRQGIFLEEVKKSNEIFVWDRKGGVAGYGLSPLLAG